MEQPSSLLFQGLLAKNMICKHKEERHSMRNFVMFFIGLLVSGLLLVACGADSTIPTLRPTLDGNITEATVDPDLGSGFDPNLGGSDNNNNPEPTPTRENNSSVGGDSESGARGIGFSAQITGGSINEIIDGGQYACNINGHLITSGNSPAPNITFTLPNTNPIAMHSLTNSNTVVVSLTLSSVEDVYAQVTGGTLTVDKIPSQAGEFVSGSFDFTIRNTTGGEIGVQGNFDFETTNTAYC